MAHVCIRATAVATRTRTDAAIFIFESYSTATLRCHCAKQTLTCLAKRIAQLQAYENLGTIGEGTFGLVAKCRHRPTGANVAVKMFKEFDKQVGFDPGTCAFEI